VTRLFLAAKALEQAGAECRAEAVDDAWRELSIEADRVVDMLRCRIASMDSSPVSR
jgi:hypothetical protein